MSEGSEQANPLALEVQTKCIVERVARFMTQNAHALDVAAAFNFAHELTLEFHQARVSQIKWNRKTGNAVGREPLCGQPDVRLKANAAIVQLAVQTFDVRLDERAFDANGKIADASVQQPLIGDQTPLESRRHASDCS